MVDNKRLLDLFKHLISFDSPSFGEQDICGFLKRKLKGLGIEAIEDSSAEKIGGTCGNLYAYIDGTLGLEPILFCAHMDTVEPAINKKMITHSDGKITSDGTTILGADDCSGIAAIIESLTVLKERNLPHRPIEILFTAAEEPYCRGIREFDFTMLKSKEAYVLDLSGPVGTAANQAPTILSFQAYFSGKAAHAGFAPEEGIHALKAAALAVSQIPCGKSGDTTVNIGTISGGTADNIVPDSCVVTGEIRSLSDENASQQLSIITDVMKNAAKNYGAEVTVKNTRNCIAYCTDTNHRVSKRFEKVCQKLGLDGKLCSTYGGSDNNHLALHGISGLVAATAMNNCHSLSEYTSEAELIRAAKLTLVLMLSQE